MALIERGLKMNSYRQRATEDIVFAELSMLDRVEIESMTFADSSEHYDYDKLTAEGSIWFVYVSDLISDYYNQNKDRIDSLVCEVLAS